MKNLAPADSPMSEKREKFQKIIAVAINPGAYEDEAIAALRRARALVQENPSLAFLSQRPSNAAPTKMARFKRKSQIITALVLPVLMTNLSAQAYGLGLKSKIEVEFIAGRTTYALNVRCDGNASACQVFEEYVS
jgi:hypothetical protein